MPQEGKTDMERLGLFKEMGYITIGDKYIPFSYKPFNESAHKNKQILSGVPKKKSGLQVGYFDSQFKRAFEKEAYTDHLKLRRQYRIQQAKHNLGKAFLPSNAEKQPSGVGSYYGTFSGPVKAMSAVQLPRKPQKSPGKNILTSPAKKGSYGYPNLTLSTLDSYSQEPYDRPKQMLKKEMVAHRSMMKGGAFRLNLHPKEHFDSNPYKTDKPLPPVKIPNIKKERVLPFKPSSPSKKMGGMKAGTFDTYPSHSADPYVTRKPKATLTNKEGKVFRPSPGPKSVPMKSILDMNVDKWIVVGSKDNICPTCKLHGVSEDRLTPNKNLRKAVDKFRKRGNSTAGNKKVPTVQLSQVTVTADFHVKHHGHKNSSDSRKRKAEQQAEPDARRRANHL